MNDLVALSTDIDKRLCISQPHKNGVPGTQGLDSFYSVKAASLHEDINRLFSGLSFDNFWPFEDVAHVQNRPEIDEGREGPVFLFNMISRMLETLQERSNGRNDSLSILVEPYHIDSVYRDSYYSILSRSHIDSKRYSYRLVFFEGKLDEEDWSHIRTSGPDGVDKLQSIFIGSCVLNPQASGSIGRTLISPQYLVRCSDSSITDYGSASINYRIRVSKFKITVRGKPLYIDAFPYRMQDSLSMMCAETTLINLVEYYANEFREYPLLRCSKIHELEAEYMNERTVPVRGISYLVASKMLAANGFYPRLFGTDSTEKQNRMFRRALFHYIDSGVPVAVNVSAQDGAIGHSLLCIGYRGFDICRWSEASNHGQIIRRTYSSGCHACTSSPNIADRAFRRFREHRTSWFNVAFAADLCDSFVVCDDNHIPYQARPFSKLSLHDDMENSNMLVALHKSMMLDAWDAEDALLGILEGGKTGLHKWIDRQLKQSGYAPESGSPTINLIVRLYMASSRRFKQARVNCLDSFRAALYEMVPLPHFIWVAEFYLEKEFINGFCDQSVSDDGFAISEIVFDATSRPANDSDTAVLIGNYPTEVFIRTPWGDEKCVPIPEDYQFRKKASGGADVRDGMGYIPAFTDNLITFFGSNIS